MTSYLCVASWSVTITLAGLAVWKVPESCLALIAAAAESVLGASALSVRFSAEGVERTLVVTIASCKASHRITISIIATHLTQLTFASFRAESVRSWGAPVTPPAHNILLAGTLARVLVA